MLGVIFPSIFILLRICFDNLSVIAFFCFSFFNQVIYFLHFACFQMLNIFFLLVRINVNVEGTTNAGVE